MQKEKWHKMNWDMMKKKNVGCNALSALWLAGVLAVALAALPINRTKGIGGDYMIYWGESECVKNGIDPYDVWCGNVANDRYYPFQSPELKTETRCIPIHGHTPWSYTYFLPFSTLLPLEWSWILWQGLCCLCIFAIAFTSFIHGRNLSGGGGHSPPPRFPRELLCRLHLEGIG